MSRPCTICRGDKVIYHRGSGGDFTPEVCPMCEGSGRSPLAEQPSADDYLVVLADGRVYDVMSVALIRIPRSQRAAFLSDIRRDIAGLENWGSQVPREPRNLLG